jgi:predicted DNA-binding antitoxin AbrB/MazE fold protein
MLYQVARDGYVSAMSFTATVENDVIKLPENTHLPNGAKVRVEVVVEPAPIAPEILARLKKISGRATTGLTTDEILRETRGED